jgi:2-haloacid dehalogenase
MIVSTATPERRPGGDWVMGAIETLVFDVLGTVVDETASIALEVAASMADAGLDPRRGSQLALEWSRRLDLLIGQVVAREEPWKSNDDLRAVALVDALEVMEIHGLSRARLDDLALVGHRLKPWPDAAQALEHLRDSFTVVALSNADLAQLVDMFGVGRLAWHGVLSAESVKTYKPDPAVYRHALDALGREARRTLMVAAHPWDLRAASVQGMRTAFVSRPGEGVLAPYDRFDLYAESLADLAEQLASG